MSDYMKLKSGTDIRGVAVDGVEGEPVTLTNEAVFAIGSSFARWILQHSGKPSTDISVAVGHDSRISAERIKSAFCDALASAGIHIWDCGLCTTPAMFMTTVTCGCDAAVSITASHHPFHRNGLKFFTAQGGLDGASITEILKGAENAKSVKGNFHGKIEKLDYLSEYATVLRRMICDGLGHIESDKPLSGLKITVDAGNGAGGFYASKVLEPLGADISGSRYLEPDGTFPNHIPNPENEYAMQCACEAAWSVHADLGIIFDTDVDRAGCVGADGREINRNRLVALSAAIALESCKGGTIVTDSVTSSGLREFIGQLGGVHYRYKRGYKNVIDEAVKLCKEGIPCPLAIETSGHAAFQENYFLDDGAYLITRIVIKMAQLKLEHKTIDGLIAQLKEPLEQCELRFQMTQSDFKACGEAVIGALTRFTEEQDGWSVAPDNREGIRVNCNKGSGDGWFLLRLSVHDPIMPLNAESDSAGGIRKMLKALSKFLETQSGISLDPLTQFLSNK